MLLLHAESGAWDFKKRHDIAYVRKGKRYYDFGLCGVSNYYHPEIVNDPRFFTDWKWQMQECHKLYKGGTTFYGAKHLKADPKFKRSIVKQYVFEQ